ncbi:retrotransposon protein, putative, ty1-copia subclass [Tanacetum coccineum]|uniref:Retrotransposon protein, putative, ty1-copia subclass n=1 Tax=Tanacetum coccineum TaxID=301880 RepID=A0ABQ5DBB3_9ASTR
MKKKKLSLGANNSGIYTIELNTFLNRSWIYDIGYGTHICNTTHGLRASRKLKPRAFSLYVGNGQCEVVEAIGVFHLCILSGLEIVLNNCYYAPSITRNNMVYFSAISRDGIFEIDLSNSYANDSSIKKRIVKLQHDRLLNSTDLRAFKKCISCMSGKMGRKSYTHQVERAKDLLGLIHTNVCGPFKTMSRQGASYFVTFTDDFSRYGYVYLLKHKHEVFETFKVFQKEVENKLGKTIKSLRFDREGEYMSQEFLDHLKDHGIIAHRTPPYTSQHNGVSERRNRTLLDMVRSMMSQTTLPKSFWDYAFETAARILNMVPTKKGCEALVKRDTLTKPNKLEPKSIKNSLITQEASGSLEDLEIIEEEDTYPSIDTSLNHEEDDLEIDEPQCDINPICRSIRTRRPTDRLCLYIDAEEHDNKVWDLVDLPPKSKTVGSKWLFKKKTDMDGAVHTYKAHIRAIWILIAIAAFYDHEIWQMDVKTAFLNGYLSEEVYMEQPVGFVNPKYSNRNSKRGSIPMQDKLRLSKSQGVPYVPYASAVGSIMYAVRCTRPDVTFAQNITIRFQQNPGDLHWTTVKKFKVSRKLKDMVLFTEVILNESSGLSCTTDAGY